MIGVALVAVLLALLRVPPLLALLVLNLTVVAYLLALVAALVGRGRTRVMAIGFVVCGGGHFLVVVLAVGGPFFNREILGWGVYSLFSLGSAGWVPGSPSGWRGSDCGPIRAVDGATRRG